MKTRPRLWFRAELWSGAVIPALHWALYGGYLMAATHVGVGWNQSFSTLDVRAPSIGWPVRHSSTRSIRPEARAPWANRLVSAGAPHGRSWLHPVKRSRPRASLAATAGGPSRRAPGRPGSLGPRQRR